MFLAVKFLDSLGTTHHDQRDLCNFLLFFFGVFVKTKKLEPATDENLGNFKTWFSLRVIVNYRFWFDLNRAETCEFEGTGEFIAVTSPTSESAQRNRRENREKHQRHFKSETTVTSKSNFLLQATRSRHSSTKQTFIQLKCKQCLLQIIWFFRK
jgi:hypothetical protein